MKTMLKTLLKTAMAATLVASAAMAAADGSCNFRSYSPAPVMQPAPAAYGWNQGYGVQGHQGGHPLAGLNEIRARQSVAVLFCSSAGTNQSTARIKRSVNTMGLPRVARTA